VSQVVMVERSLLVIRGRPLPKGNEMKIHRLFVGLVAAFAVSLASVAVSATAAETPFKGTVNAVETSQVVFPTASVTRDGGGTATYLGKYTEHVTVQVNIPTGHGIGPRPLRRRTATP
jgi:hypothetical protein